jgi:hypothetical protein
VTLMLRLRHRAAARADDPTKPTAMARRRRAGQGLVEFAVAVIPFLVLLMAVVDLGRGIYVMNGTSEAARDIARATSVHQWTTCCDLGSSTEAGDVIATQRRLIPGLVFAPSTDIVCVDSLDQVLDDDQCQTGSGNYVRVHLSATFSPMTPLVSALGSHTFDSTSRIKIP